MLSDDKQARLLEMRKQVKKYPHHCLSNDCRFSIRRYGPAKRGGKRLVVVITGSDESPFSVRKPAKQNKTNKQNKHGVVIAVPTSCTCWCKLHQRKWAPKPSSGANQKGFYTADKWSIERFFSWKKGLRFFHWYWHDMSLRDYVILPESLFSSSLCVNQSVVIAVPEESYRFSKKRANESSKKANKHWRDTLDKISEGVRESKTSLVALRWNTQKKCWIIWRTTITI